MWPDMASHLPRASHGRNSNANSSTSCLGARFVKARQCTPSVSCVCSPHSPAGPSGGRSVPNNAHRDVLPHSTGMGGKVADALRSIGISSIAQLQGISDTQLVAQLALRPATAARLVAWGRGDDEAVVVEQGPSKSMQVGHRTPSCGAVRCARLVPAAPLVVCVISHSFLSLQDITQSHTPSCRVSRSRGLFGTPCKKGSGPWCSPHGCAGVLNPVLFPAQASALPHLSSCTVAPTLFVTT